MFMKVFVVIFTVIFILTVQAVYSTQLNSGWTIVKSNQQELILSFKPHLNGFDTIHSTTGDLLLIPKIQESHFSDSKAGIPISISSIVNFTVPSASGFSVESISIGSVKSINRKIAPKPRLN